MAVPGELFFAVGLFALLGRKRVVPYSLIRVVRRGVLLVMIVAAAAIARLSLDVALVLNLVALAMTAAVIVWVAATDGIVGSMPIGDAAGRGAPVRHQGARPGRSPSDSSSGPTPFLINIILGVRETGIYSVTSGLAETLWYVPNALGTVMFSRAVDPKADAGRIAVGPDPHDAGRRPRRPRSRRSSSGRALVRFVYGSQFADAGVALRLILPGIVAYSVVAVLSRYITGRGRPGTGTLILVAGLVVNIAVNLVLIPRYGIDGAAAASSVSYIVTAMLTLVVFRRMSGRGWVETLVIRRVGHGRPARRLAGRRRAAARAARRDRSSACAADPMPPAQIIDEREPGEEL